MGDIAEMMLDGTLCQSCGGYIGSAVGFPRECRSCKPKPRVKSKKQNTKPQEKKDD